jgi:DNA (cytosine-5)-methyltransferase 1
MNELALFAGAGGGILGGHLLGWRTVCAVEWDAYAASVLVARQNDGCLPPFPIWDDVQTFDGRPWRGRVDVVSGGFPCQDISCAGKGEGISGERSGMWKHMARIIGEVLPQFVFVENSPMLVGRGGAVVIADLAEMGYDAEWGIVGAHHAAAPHKRDRIWIVAQRSGQFPHAEHDRTGWREQQSQGTQEEARNVADTQSPRTGNDGENNGSRCGEIHTPDNASSTGRGNDRPQDGKAVADANGTGCKEQRFAISDGQEHETAECGGWWATEPDVGRVAHGVAARVDRLRCIGNGQVPAVAQLAWDMISSTDY